MYEVKCEKANVIIASIIPDVAESMALMAETMAETGSFEIQHFRDNYACTTGCTVREM